jgi:hypothetical protein
VGGAPLDRYVGSGRAVGEGLRVVRRVGEALAFAHSRGMIHRDLKPQNVMVGEFGEVYLMDWGVGAVGGTAGFRAPEATLDWRSDIYALGALLQFVLPQPAPAALAAIVGKAMSADAGARYADVTAMLADLGRYEDGLAVTAWREPALHGFRRFWSRNAVLLWLLTAYAAVKLGLYFWPLR